MINEDLEQMIKQAGGYVLVSMQTEHGYSVDTPLNYVEFLNYLIEYNKTAFIVDRHTIVEYHAQNNLRTVN